MTAPVESPRPAWPEDAACKGMPIEVFMPWPSHVAVRQQDRRKAQPALEVCASCPVVAECAADTHEDDWSTVRAGLTPAERLLPSHPSWFECDQCGRGFTTSQGLSRHKGSHGQAECGTVAGYHRHRRAGVTPCEACRLASNAYKRGQRRSA